MTSAFWDDTHTALKASLDGWVSENVRPHSADWEEAEAMPDSLFGQAGDAGVAGEFNSNSDRRSTIAP